MQFHKEKNLMIVALEGLLQLEIATIKR